MALKLVTDNPDSQYAKQAIMIDEDRYGGCYSGYAFTAWFNDIPDEASAGDCSYGQFWKNNSVVFGGGNTPDEAVADLFKKFYQDNIQLERDGKIITGERVYVETIWNTSCYSGRCPVDQRVIWTKEDSRFEVTYPKAAAIFRLYWGE